MSCILLFLFAIVSCSAQELLSPSDPDHYDISVVELPKIPSTESRIIGGTATSIEKYPFIVQVLYLNNLYCGGSLLTRRHVLSAGHCFVDDQGALVSPRFYSIRAGTANLNSGGVVHGVSALVVHERYNVPLRDNDVAIMLLSSAVTFTNSVQAGLLPAAGGNLADNSIVIAIGWGRTNVNIAAVSPVLNEVSVLTVNQETCAARYTFLETLTKESYPVTDSMLCAGLLDIGGADACQGDSGGPLIYEGVIVGITSWGAGCAEPLFPGVYARVSSYTNWINQTVGDPVAAYSHAASSHLVSFTTLLIPLLLVMLSV